MATTKDGIWTPDQEDDFNLVGDLATTASTIQSALDRRANAYRGTSSERELFTNEAAEGTIWVDTNGLKRAWVKQENEWEVLSDKSTEYYGSDIFSSLESGITVPEYSVAVVKGNITTMNLSLIGISRDAGHQSIPIGTIRPEVKANRAVGFSGYYTNGSVQLAIITGGAMSLRWSDKASTNQIYSCASWVIT